MLPQWPLVVTATMLQFPSNWAAIAGRAEQRIGKAIDRAKAHIRLPIMKVMVCSTGSHKRSPGDGGYTGASGSVGGEPVMGLAITRLCSTPPCVFSATQVDLSLVPFCRPG
jgi:hypothetical protein